MANALTLSRPKPLLRDIQARAAALWRAYPRETLGLGLFGLVTGAALASTTLSSSERPQAAPPAPPSMAVRPLAPDQALKLNSEIPVAHGPNPAAVAFEFKGSAAAKAQALNCLASAVYYEAGNQDLNGERAVAQVVLNRVRHPAFPGSVCGVVYQGSERSTGCQFTFTCDGSMNAPRNEESWARSEVVARAALAGDVDHEVGLATNYHANWMLPWWASGLERIGQFGTQIFYKWKGALGNALSFTQPYSGVEPEPSVGVASNAAAR